MKPKQQDHHADRFRALHAAADGQPLPKHTRRPRTPQRQATAQQQRIAEQGRLF